MKVFRIKIQSWTASFRYPNFILGYQPSLDVPALSTILGLINAAAGEFLYHDTIELAYYFEYEAKSTDLETIYQIEIDKKKLSPKLQGITSNVINREFLYGCTLFLYLKEERLAAYFRKPVFQLLLGRSSDLASVKEIKQVELEQTDSAKCLAGQIVPFEGNFLPGQILPLPKYFTFENPRQIIGTETYSIIPYNKPVEAPNLITYRDKFKHDEIRIKGSECEDENNDKFLNLYFHKLQFNEW